MAYAVFHRTWWAENPDYPGGLEPCPGPRTYLARNIPTAAEARALAQEWNRAHKPGRLSRKAEFEEQEPTVRRQRRVAP